MTDNAHSCPSSGFYTIKSWDQVSEPWDKAGRRYGPDWSVDENLEPKETPGQTGAMVWSIPFNSTYVYPEMRPDLPVGKMLRSRPNLGVCMSGGGMRAATCALGWYRGLNHLNLLQKVRYVSANSGATWTSLPLTCRSLLQKKELGTDIDLDEFVGKYGGKYDEHTVLRERSIIGDNLVNANILDPEFVSKTPGFSAWSTAINKNFVDPLMDIRQGWNWENDFWLDLSNVYLWNTDATKHILEKSLPFLILVSTGYEARNRKEFIPIENTLLYSGVPVDPRKLNEKSSFGGGFVQESNKISLPPPQKGVALNAESLENKEPVPSDDNILFLKEFKNPSPVVKIAQLTSAASAFVAAADAIFKIDLRDSITRKLLYRLGKFFKGKLTRINNLIDYLDPGKFKWWSPTTGGEPVELNFVDGGLFDNLGALALLRRRCSTIILCYAPTADVFDVIEPEKLHYCYFDLSALFGRGASQIPEWAAKKGYKDTFNERSQVFAGEELDSLMDEMRALRKQGKPLVVRKLLQVIPNHLAGIYESYEVDMIFCFSGVVEEFCKSETEEKTNLLSKIFGKKKKGDNFPYIDTLKCDYSMQLVSKLSSLNSYNLVEGLKNVGFDIEQVR